MKLRLIFISLVMAVAVCVVASAASVIVDGTHVRLRLGPSTSHAILSDSNGSPIYPAKGAKLTYISTEGDFYKVKHNGTTCYISRDYAHLSNETSKKSTTTSMDKKLVGKHLLSLQWISWEYFGSCNITKVGENRYSCVGEQLSREHKGDYLKIEGYISVIDELNLEFTGEIRTKVYHIKGGEEYVRSGTFLFQSTQGRRYWRLQDMNNGECTDYVDIYWKR